MKLAITADLHGNEEQYKKVLNFIKSKPQIEAILIDGDISVRRSTLRDSLVRKIEKEKGIILSKEEISKIETNEVINEQYKWFTNVFFQILKGCSIPIYINMGK